MNVLILGVTGMLGNAMFRHLSADTALNVCGTARNQHLTAYFSADLAAKIVHNVDVENQDSLIRLFDGFKPQVVINCIGLVKQLFEVNNPLLAVPINTLLPHRLAALCKLVGARLIHISTDCVFSGAKGGYLESDFPDAYDLYGRTKLLGEVDYPHAVTLRTSIIGHELSGSRSLIGWFLAQKGDVKGFKKAIFSGLPTNELAHVVKDYVLKNEKLFGVYHVAAEPINKFELLKLVADVYGKSNKIVPDETLVINRSLNSLRFNQITGYQAPEWSELIKSMFEFQKHLD
ncbi:MULTISPECIES: dTDP-4-dehydrorhamnose reductase family protein [Methylomonas]|uniref:dTDP-4-dehydrorhamnose reductase n=2 Tax=Methylomonas TaxID=416 RepID=A0A140E3Z1_9GAMM|nr:MULTISPECIES: SDR family oxidoreductase [Methylomonas]AMK75115.1 NAD(P)-dependent oxidoreductase [Methylomonas denitrificans]OAI02605.1 NAD(P)-dependent oxidoreductase [Methylomonas methanica]TCV83069.1 dTDP-4-dehydrorhamnose reductase [Methylomonas methanica]